MKKEVFQVPNRQIYFIMSYFKKIVFKCSKDIPSPSLHTVFANPPFELELAITTE